MAELVDAAKPVREGEELDVDRLQQYLATHCAEFRDGAPLSVKQFPSGHSNLTYLLTAGERQYVLRRPPFGTQVKKAHDMGREFKILSKLQGIYPKAPEPLVFCDDPGVMGADFYVMRRLRGIILRKQLPEGLSFDPEQYRTLNRRMIDALAEIHALDYEAAGLGDLGKPAGYVERQVSGWTKRYEGSQTDELPVVQDVARWLAEHRPAEVGAALIHNDFKLDNLVLNPDDPLEIIGVLDWEMSTLGDPLMDLGTTLGYWIEAEDPPPMQAFRTAPPVDGALTRQELADYYGKRTGRDVSNVLFYYAFGLFKTAVVIQQIYFRYKKGLTKDERFAAFIVGVQMLCHQASASIEKGRI